MSYTYAAIYTAFRNGASKTHTVAYQSEQPIDSGELLSALIDGVARSAVSNGQANSVNDVSLTGISLLTPPAPVDSAEKLELATAVADLFETLKMVISRNSMSDADHLSLLDTIESHQATYNKCSI